MNISEAEKSEKTDINENGVHEAIIPQHVEEGLIYNSYAGHVLEITVE